MLVKVSLAYIMINKLNIDQALIKIRRLEKMHHVDSAQRSQTDGPSHGRTCCYTLVIFITENRNKNISCNMKLCDHKTNETYLIQYGA